MEYLYDFDVIDIAERSPVKFASSQSKPDLLVEEGLKTSKSWCGPISSLIGEITNIPSNVSTAWYESRDLLWP